MRVRASCAAAAFAWALSGCGGGGGHGTAPEVAQLTASEVSLAERLAATQLNDGFWDFEHPHDEAVDFTGPGFQNTAGVTADGLLGAYAVDRLDGTTDVATVLPALIDAKNALIALCDAFIAGTGPRPSLSNFVFLGRYRDIVGLTPDEEARARSALMLRLTQDDLTHGTDPTVIVDGWLNLVAESRSGIPGIIGWDTAFLVKVALLWALPATDLAYAVDFLKALPIDSSVDYGMLSAAHVLEVLNMTGVDDAELNSALVAAIQARATPGTIGSYNDVSDDPAAAYQSTAYVLMAYKEIDAPEVGGIEAWLSTQVHADGSMWDPVTGVENFELEGEVLLALTK